MKNHTLKAFVVLAAIMLHAKLYSQEDGKTYYFQSALAGKYLDVKNANPNRKTPLHLWPFNGGMAQKFTLKDAGEGYFYIISNTQDRRAIHVYGANKAPKAEVNLWDVVNQDNLKWKFKKANDGYVYIQSKIGTYLDVQWGKSDNGTPIWMWSFNGGNAQKWKLKLAENLSKPQFTTFRPKEHGFKFRNKFKSTVGDAGSIKFEFNGLCGGMAYTANDYFLGKLKIPQQNFQPAIGTKLHSYIFNRQQNSFSNLDKFLEYTVNPFGWRDKEFFYWGLEGRLFELKNCIDKNQPMPLGLFNIHNNPTSHHQVLAIGYDLAGHAGNKEKDPDRDKVRIYIYDPNYPDKTCALIPVSNKAFYAQEVGSIKNGKFIKEYRLKNKKWRSYFLDSRYRKKTPPRTNKPYKTESTKINRLLFNVTTGGDDLRGGNDNVHFHIYFKDGTKQTIYNANKKHRWPDNHSQTVEIYLDKSVHLNQIDKIELQTTFGGGMFGDNWNMDAIKITAIQGDGKELSFYENNGRPLKRFTGDHQLFSTQR